MACSDCDGKAAMPLEEATDGEDLITGEIEGLEVFLEGRCRRFKDAEELGAYHFSREGLPSSSSLGGLSHE